MADWNRGLDEGSACSFEGAKVAILGYCEEVRAQAKRLARQGALVSVAVRPGGMSWIRAMEDGFRPCAASEAVEGADVVVMAVPEPEQPALFSSNVQPHLAQDTLVVFLRGGPVFAGALMPAEDVDVVLVRASGLPGTCLVAVHQDSTGTACERALAFARSAHGDGARTLVTTTFAEAAIEEIEAEAEKYGGTSQLVASWEEHLARAGHEPDEAEMTYYRRLCDAVIAAKHGVPMRRVPVPPASGLVVDTRQSRPSWQVAMFSRRGVA